MNAYTWLAIHDVACIAAATFLVINDKPGWACVFVASFLFASVKTSKP